MVNQKKIGRYEVVSVLGRGAMGTVYKAIDPVIERTVAIKTISLDQTKDERVEFEERFYREAKSAGRLNHPNIVTIYDVGETDEAAYIAMEFLEGESLRELLDSGVVLPVDQIVRIAVRIAGALNYAHENHVVHRDIKPANIMIARNRDVKIMDFGIAKISTGSRTLAGTVLGSPKYMAPEQVVGKDTDGRADIFALGAMLYEMLTGSAPFSGDNLNSIMYKILNEEPAPPSTITARVPPVFDRIVAKALAKRPEDRYQTAKEFARDLRNSEASISREARPREVKAAKPPPKVPAPVLAQDATVVLSPRNAAIAVGNGGHSGEVDPPLLEKLASRKKLLLIAIPAAGAVAFALFFLRLPGPHETGTPAPAAQSNGQTSADPPQPATPTAATAPPAGTPPEASAPNAAKPADAIAAGETALATPTPRVAAIPATTATPTAPPTPAIAAPLKATVFFAVAPWGNIIVDGKNVGVSPPLTSLKVTPGSHTVEIRNQAFAPYRDTVNLGSGESLKIKHKFR
jgi:serine/threonine-protein kinase